MLYLHNKTNEKRVVLCDIEGIADILNCRRKLEKAFDMIISGMAFPDIGINKMNNGVTYKQINAYLTELDIAYSRLLGVQNHSFDLPDDWHKWYPTVHHNDGDVFELIKSFVEMKVPDYGAIRWSKLFYLWGHAYGFDQKTIGKEWKIFAKS